MTDARQPRKLSSAFDDMASQNRKRFDDLYRGSRGQAVGTSATKDALGRLRNQAASPAAIPVPGLDPNSPVLRQLRERYGNDWRFEVAERQRVGDEAIVLGKLTVGKDGGVRTQFGRAAISPAPVAGASGNVKFKLAAAGGETDEREAFRRAIEAALTNCLDLI